MKEPNSKKTYAKPIVISEKVFEQAALSCVVAPTAVAPATTTLKISAAVHGCGYTSS